MSAYSCRFFQIFLISIFLSISAAQASDSYLQAQQCRHLNRQIVCQRQKVPAFKNQLWFIVSFDEDGKVSSAHFDESLPPVFREGKYQIGRVMNISNEAIDEPCSRSSASHRLVTVLDEDKRSGEEFLSTLTLKPLHFSGKQSIASTRGLSNTFHVSLGNSPSLITAYSDDLNLGPWVNSVSKKAHKVWFPPKCVHPVRVSFRVTKNGRVSEVKMSPPSGLQVQDRAALKAVMAAAPYEPLPAGAPASLVVELELFWYALQPPNCRFKSL